MTIWTDDEVGGTVWSENEAAGTALGADGGAALVGFVQTGTGAVSDDVQEALRNGIVSVMSFIPPDLRAGIRANTGSTDLATYIQAAIDAMHATTPGGTLYFPPGLYVTGQLTLKYKVSLLGPAPSRSALGTAILHLKDAANVPLIVNDQTNGPSQGTGLDGGTQRNQVSSIRYLCFRGNAAGQTSIDADIIYLRNAWNTDIRGCLFLQAKGFGIRALDCNILHIRDSQGFDAPVFWESVADGTFMGNEWGHGTGIVYPVFWMSEANCWQNIISGNFIYNNSSNLGVSQPTFTSDSGGTSHILTTNANHNFTDGTPVVVSTTSALPTGLSANTTYYAKSLSANTVRLASTRANLTAGTFVNVSGAGTGTHTIGVGRNAGMYLNSGAKWNQITGNRFDQNYGHGLLLGTAIENSISANTINLNGLGNATAQSGIKLESSTRNGITGNLIDGSALVVGSNTANQTIGIEGDSGSTGNVISPQRIHDHSSADLSMSAGYTSDEKLDEIFLPVRSFGAISGTPAIGLIGGSRREGWLFDSGSDEVIQSTFLVPKGWTKFNCTLYWVNAGAGSGDVEWFMQAREFAVSESLDQADNLSLDGAAQTAGARDILMSHVFASGTLACTAGELFAIRVKRDASVGTDTLGNDAAVFGLKLTRA